MNKRKIRDSIRLIGAITFGWLYIPHIIIGGSNLYIKSDVQRMLERIDLRMPNIIGLVYFLHNNAYFRSLFYYRIGPIASLFIEWYRPGDKYFTISKTLKMGKGCRIAHPYATILNAETIGDNFTCLHCTTLGSTSAGRPVIGNNVSLGAAVTIIGNVHIGNNVKIGAGSVVVKDIPDNCIAAGNPARIIRRIEE